MHHGNCSCLHHWGEKIVIVLVWIVSVLFFWSGLKGVIVWGYDPLFYAWSVVILSLMAFSLRYCRCCGGGKRMDSKVCSHEEECKCGDCDRCC